MFFFLTYSEGIRIRVNRVAWSLLPCASVTMPVTLCVLRFLQSAKRTFTKHSEGVRVRVNPESARVRVNGVVWSLLPCASVAVPITLCVLRFLQAAKRG